MKYLIAFVSALAMSNGAHAMAIYTYQGNLFTRFHSDSDPRSVHPKTVFTAADSVSMEVVLSGEIPVFSNLRFNTSMVPIFNSSFGNSPITPISWKVSAGPLSFSGSAETGIPPRTSASISLSTDGTGAVRGWDVEVTGFLEDVFADGTVFRGADGRIASRSTANGNGEDLAIGCLGDVACLQSSGYPTGSSGTWDVRPAGHWTVSITAVPEPEPAAFLAIGLVALAGGMARTRRRRATL